MTIPWDFYSLDINLINIAGGLPTDPKLVEAWQRANWKKSAKLLANDPQTPEEAAVKTLELLEGVESEAGWTTFARDQHGVFCKEGRDIKAMFKEAANILKGLLPVNGKVIPLRSKLAERVFIEEDLIPMLWITGDASMGPKDYCVTEPSRVVERAIHVMTAQGPRDALKRTDVCDAVELHCTLRVLGDGIFKEAMLRDLLDYCCQNGLGADRSQGYGQFSYELRPGK